jgi:phosphotransferase system enzyme I (PtsI)
MVESGKKQTVVVNGIVGSVGSCVAKAYVFKKRIEVKTTSINENQVDRELERLDAATQLTRRDLLAAQKLAEEKHGVKYAAIFDSHLLMLEDPQFVPQIISRLKKAMVNVESIVREIVDQLQTIFSAIEDPYLRERAIDVKDVGDRLLRHLMGLEGPAAEIGNEPYVLIGSEVTPGEILDFSKGNLQGVCLDSGGATSHVAILSGALGIPSVFGLSDLTLAARTGDEILIDTRNGCKVILNPDQQVKDLLLASQNSPESTLESSDITADGFQVSLGANIARAEELEPLKKQNIKRIGLFRSEFLFMESMDLPSEEFQYGVYKQVIDTAKDSAILRTIDIGSDKPLKYIPFPKEENPAMGFRSIRFSLSREEILLPQLRAMIRAADGSNCKIIFPMISTSNELKQIDLIYKKAVEQVKPKSPPEWGIMVEVPSTVFMMEEISKYTNYISLGTNDLLQFFYAIDRTNQRLADLANPLNIPFLRLIFTCLSAARAERIKLCVCGEMAADPAGFLSLLGIGVEDFSMRPSSIKRIKQIIPLVERDQLCSFIQQIIAAGEEINIRNALSEKFPALKDFIFQDK